MHPSPPRAYLLAPLALLASACDDKADVVADVSLDAMGDVETDEDNDTNGVQDATGSDVPAEDAVSDTAVDDVETPDVDDDAPSPDAVAVDADGSGETDVVSAEQGADCSNALDDDRDGFADCIDDDCLLDLACAFACGDFSEAPAGWVLAPGLRAVVVADAADGLEQPVGLTFAGREFGWKLFVSDQAAGTVWAVDPADGATSAFAQRDAFEPDARLLTAIVWDAAPAFDGKLYVSDSGTDGDQDNVIFRLAADGTPEVFVAAPGPGLDSVYAMAFSPAGVEPSGLYVAGDTDTGLVDWGVFDAEGSGLAYSEVAGVEGIAFDDSGRYGTGPIAARPLGGGYDGDGTLTPIDADGTALTPIASGLGGVHANVVAPPGLFDNEMLAASWSSGTIFRIAPDGTKTEIASGLALTNYDANILAVSPDGRTLWVADRLASRIVCIEQIGE